MAPKTYVGFVAEFPDDHDGGAPAGFELAEFVSNQLRNLGYSVESPCDNEGWSWEFVTKSTKFQVYTIVGLVGDTESDPPRQWLITNDSKPGIFKRLFGGNSVVREHEEFLTAFCEQIHLIIDSDDRFSHIAWYDSKTFDQLNDQPSSTP